MADFNVQISQWVEKADGNVVGFIRAFVLRMVERIKSYTPVETGRLRASIQAVPEPEHWNGGEPIVIGTNVEYARRVEYGFSGVDSLGRRYHQTGAGMFTRAAAESDDVAEQALSDIKQ